MTPGDRIRTRRTDLGLSIEALAHEAGVSTATISRIERNHPTQPGLSVLRGIAGALKTTVGELVDDTAGSAA